MDLRDGGGGDRLAEFEKKLVDGTAERDLDHAHRFRAGEGRHAVLQALQVAGRRDADDVGTGRQELAEFHVRRPEPRQRLREARRAVAGLRPLDEPRDPQAEPGGRRQGARIDERERALAGQDEAGAQIADEMNEAADHVSDLPAGMDGDDAGRERAVRHAPEARLLDHPREGGRRREAADRFHQILVGFRIPRHHAARASG